jgi:hypothetical protein
VQFSAHAAYVPGPRLYSKLISAYYLSNTDTICGLGLHETAPKNPGQTAVGKTDNDSGKGRFQGSGFQLCSTRIVGSPPDGVHPRVLVVFAISADSYPACGRWRKTKDVTTDSLYMYGGNVLATQNLQRQRRHAINIFRQRLNNQH